MRLRTTTMFLALLILATAALVPTRVYTQNAGTIGPPTSVPGIDKPVRVISGRFTSSITLTNDSYWVLRGAVFIARGADLNIQAGTRIVGEFATLGTLVIEKGGRIFAVGTVTQPIVFTSDQPVGQRSRADWGGLIINGEAPVNLPGGVGLGEGDTGEYGGNFPNDNSGVLKYVLVEYAGIEFSPDNELNGVAFQAVGRGTTVDYLQVSFNKDDGIEFFGGTADVKHYLSSGNADDSLDWTFGWTGRVQFVVLHQRGDDADNGFEGDNNGNNNDLLPRSAPRIYNATLIGDPSTTWGNESDDGMEIREGTAGTFRNFIVTGFKEHGLDISNTATIDNANTGTLTFGNGIISGNAILSGETELDSDAAGIASITQNPTLVIGGANPGLIDPFNHANPNYRPAAGSLAATMAPATPPNDGFFEVAPYIGAVSPTGVDWTRTGWANFEQGG